ncbi:MAG TPA: glutamine-hydrolyzing carbamoyl-phosphate synthase small subunit [Acidimicrobiales bacterium]|nr:glutamine-hydrolyzing carbamoyl-phosphate synthase small subunit [Acidimicrobiales bacterium]
MRRHRPEALLVLADGTVFEGEAIGALAVADGAPASTTGELVFNTCLSGYQEVITDPSYAGQVIAFTYPHIGNYGVSPEDEESGRPFCRGIVVRDLAPRPSNWRAADDLESYLVRHAIGGITGVDTRRLTRHVRESGAMPCAIGTISEHELLRAARSEPGTEGIDLVTEVTAAAPYIRERRNPTGEATAGRHLRVVAYDFGIKETILANLTRIATVEVVPAGTPAGEVIARGPDGVFLSNGPGDPAALPHLTKTISDLVGTVPVFGICLGHQLLATALGGGTYKLKFGHHGGNHPVKRVETGAVEITSHNHGYAVVPDSVERVMVTHVDLNDGVIEGLRCLDAPAFSVQYHPEAGPGPHDARYLFEAFRSLMAAS